MDIIIADMILINKILVFTAFIVIFALALFKFDDVLEKYLKKKIENDLLVGVITTITCLEVVAFFAAIIDLSCKYFLGKL